MKPKFRLLLAEDHSIVREGLKSLLSLDESLVLVGEASTGKQAVELNRKLKPNIVIMDIAMPGLNGFEATRQILKENPDAKILILSAHSDDEYIARVTETGAVGYMVKQSSCEQLIYAVHEVAKGRHYYSPSIANRQRYMQQRAKELGIPPEKMRRPLTPREAEVLQRVAEGEPNKQIADHLGISIKTVEKHRQQLMDKLNIHDTASLTRYAIATGIIESSTQSTFE